MAAILVSPGPGGGLSLTSVRVAPGAGWSVTRAPKTLLSKSVSVSGYIFLHIYCSPNDMPEILSARHAHLDRIIVKPFRARQVQSFAHKNFYATIKLVHFSTKQRRNNPKTKKKTTKNERKTGIIEEKSPKQKHSWSHFSFFFFLFFVSSSIA